MLKREQPGTGFTTPLQCEEDNMGVPLMDDEEKVRIRQRLDELGVRFQVLKPGEDDDEDENDFDDDEDLWEDWT